MRTRAASLVLGLVLGACAGPPPTHVLIVRHPELKCALIAFSRCGVTAGNMPQPEAEIDAGVTRD